MRGGIVTLLLAILGLGGGVNRKNQEGAELYREGKLDEALAAFTQAQVESPDAPEIHYNIGNVHYRKEETDKALQEYRTSLRGERELQEWAHYNIGNVQYGRQSFQDAVEAYKQALKIEPGDRQARQNLELALKAHQQQERPEREQQNQDQQQETEERQDNEEQQPQDQSEMSKEEAERILAALAEAEKDEQRRQLQNQQVVAHGKKKDW